MKNLCQIEIESVSRLEPLYGENEARSIVRALLEHYCDVAARDYVIEPKQTVDTAKKRSQAFIPSARAELHASSFDEAMVMCEKARPLQYVVGRAVFYDKEFYVCEGVLIPREETVELVQKIASDMRGSNPCASILDIGTGSGCIALSLAEMLHGAQVEACDISPQAAEIFKINRELLGVEAELFEIDILSEDLPKKYDVIVSNPPYVLESERVQMRANVLDYEPSIALFVDDSDPLLFYRRIAELATEHLNDGGRLYFEINERFGDQTLEMLESKGFSNVEIFRDIFDKQRMVKALWQSTNR